MKNSNAVSTESEHLGNSSDDGTSISKSPVYKSGAKRASRDEAVSSEKKFKTEMCNGWEENGGNCKYGSKCKFAHGKSELRPFGRHPRYKTEKCRTYHAKGLCNYGKRCHFIHDETDDDIIELQLTSATANTISNVQVINNTIVPCQFNVNSSPMYTTFPMPTLTLDNTPSLELAPCSNVHSLHPSSFLPPSDDCSYVGGQHPLIAGQNKFILFSMGDQRDSSSSLVNPMISDPSLLPQLGVPAKSLQTAVPSSFQFGNSTFMQSALSHPMLPWCM